MTKELNEQTMWNGSYKGARYQICHWGKPYMNEGKGMWNYYILIYEDMLSEEDFQKVWLPVDKWLERSNGRKDPMYNYYDSILELGDFHGGITHYSKHQDPDSNHKYIKVGCDYGHLWDMERGYPYTLASVELDAKQTIDKLCKALRFKVPCKWNGKWDYPENMIEQGNGIYLSHEGKKQMEKS